MSFAFDIQNISRVPKKKLSASVVRSLALQIIQAGSNAGFDLPPEPELGKRLEVSRTVLREAIKVLEAKGLIGVGHGQGMRARPRREWNHLDPDVLAWQAEAGGDEQFARDLSELRQIIEPAAAELAAHRANDEELNSVRRCYVQMEEKVHDAEAYIQADLEFHNAIFAACGNQLLARMTQAIGAVLRVSRDISIRVPGGWADSLRMHKELADAIAARDAVAARAAATVITRGAARDMNAVLDARLSKKSNLDNS